MSPKDDGWWPVPDPFKCPVKCHAKCQKSCKIPGYFTGSGTAPWSWILIVDGLSSMALGSYFFIRPHEVLDSTLVPAGDGVQWHIARCVGAQFVHAGLAGLAAGVRRGRPEVRTAMHMTRLVFAAALVMITLHMRLHVNGGNAIFLADTAVLTTFICANLIVLHTIGLWHTRMEMGAAMAKHSKLATLLLNLDSMAAKIIGLGWLIFPDWILKRQVNVPLGLEHVYLGRLMGCWFLASSVASAQMHYFRSAADRRLYIVQRAVMCLGIFSAQLWSQHAYHEHWASNHWVGISLFSTWTASAVVFALMCKVDDDKSDKVKVKSN